MIPGRPQVFGTLLSIFLLACGPTEEEIRSIVDERMRESSVVRHLTGEETIGPYSPAVSVGNFLFLSGQIGLLPGTRTFAGEDITSQTRQALRNISTLLAREGLDSSDVVQCTVYLTDIRHYQEMNLVYGGFFVGGRYPARTTVEVAELPAGALVEIAAIAYSE